MKIKYKVLKQNMLSPFIEKKYELNKIYTCENFDDDIDNDCSRGLYATDFEGIL